MLGHARHTVRAEGRPLKAIDVGCNHTPGQCGVLQCFITDRGQAEWLGLLGKLGGLEIRSGVVGEGMAWVRPDGDGDT